MKISIITPVKDIKKSFLEGAIHSVLNQSFEDYELLIIYDKNDNKSKEDLEEYKKFKKIKILESPGNELTTALNFGIENAEGDLIARFDADDIMLSERLLLQHNLFEQNPQLNLCAGDAAIIDDTSNLTGSGLLSTPNLERLYERCCIVHPTVMWRKKYFNDNNLKYRKEYEHAEDYDLWFQYIKTSNPTYIAINKPLIHYRLRSNNSTAKNFQKGKECSRKILKDNNVTPYVSVIFIGEESNKQASIDSLENGNYFNYEIVKTMNEAKGKYISFLKYKNAINRLDRQIQILERDKKLVGVGSFIKTEKGTFFYTSEPHVIESELLKGHIVIEPGTFTFRNVLNLHGGFSDDNIFSFYCSLLEFGKLGNCPELLVEEKNYKPIPNDNLVERIKFAKSKYKDIINIVHLNITSEGNISGVDRYIKTLEDNYPNYVRSSRITFVSSNKIEWKLNPYHTLIYYNPDKTKLENLYDQFWDNLADLFTNRHNLIIQSNCLNLYSLITYIKRKIRCVHLCAMHCVPFREVIRFDRKKYEELNILYEDISKDFIETPEHIAALSLADHVILNTKDSEQYFNRVGFLTPYTVIHNGIEKIERKQHNSEFKFIFVGHGSPLKGLDQLLPIIEEVSQTHKFKVIWVGSPDQKLLEIIKKKNLPIEVKGVISPEELNKLYSEVDCSLIASACETCSYAAIEALSAELPIISTKSPGLTEIVENVGLLIDIDKSGILNKDQYKKAMISVLENEQLRLDMSAASLKKYQQYSVRNLINNSVKLYEELLGK